MNIRINILIGLILALFLAGGLYFAWYLGRKQTTQADVSLIPAATTSQLNTPVTTGAKTATTTTTSSSSTTAAPAATNTVTLQLSAGNNLVSFGHRFSPSNCRNLFANLSTRDVSAMRQGKWVSCFTGDEWSSVPGESYFVKSDKGENLTIPVSGTPVSLKDRFSFDLVKGWNAIGNPFNKSVTLNPEIVFNGQTFTFKEALDKKYISSVFWYNPLAKTFEEMKEGDSVPANRGLIVESSAKGQLTFLAPGE